MRVPHEITGNVRLNGSISIFYIWPEFVPYSSSKKQYPSGLQKSFDQIEIFITPPRRGPKDDDMYTQGQNAYLRKKARIDRLSPKWKTTSEFNDGLEAAEHVSIPRVFRRKDSAILEPLGLPVLTHCDPYKRDTLKEKSAWNKLDAPTSTSQCGINAAWKDGHSIRIRFQRKHLEDTDNIYEKVIQLHDSLIVPKPPTGWWIE